jgi:protein-S-isoprenylcysteine O-methyltransferase Ste14
VSRGLVVRAAALYAPLAATIVLWLLRRPALRERAAVLLAAAWNLPSLLLIHTLAGRLGWWRFSAEGGLLLGFPVDLYLGWCLLWGPVATLAFPRLALPLLLALAAGLDAILMPAARPVVVLGRLWLVGEAVGLLLALLPAQLLARWTAGDRRLPERAALQVALFAGLTLYVVPAAILANAPGSVAPFGAYPGWLVSATLQLAALAAVPGLSAVQEFCERGRGTPLPFDPPKRLVTSGVYSYVANPMQLSASLVLAIAGVALGSLWVAAAGAMCLAYGAGLASWHEAELEERFGEAWVTYRRHVRNFVPRFRPWIPAPARLFVAETCAPCSQVGVWLSRRRPVELSILGAERHPDRDLSRMTYESADGSRSEGVAAVARALEHIHLGWAFVGWTLRLPFVRHAVQIVFDASGGGPRVVRRQA